MAAAADPLRRTLFDVPVAAGEDTTLVPYVSHLTAKEQLAAHIHIHLLFSPGQEDTWTLLERQFPKASEREFNSAIALLEMEDVVSIDPHPHFPQEMLVKIDNSSALDPEAASVPLPFPGFRYPEFPTPLGTGRNSGTTSASLTRPHTPAKNVQFLPMAAAAASPGPLSASLKKARSSTGGSIGSGTISSNGVGGGIDPGAEPGSWAGWALGAWSHTPPRMSEAMGGEEEDLVESLDETSIESPASVELHGQVAEATSVVDDEGDTLKAPQREGSVGEAALLRLVGVSSA